MSTSTHNARERRIRIFLDGSHHCYKPLSTFCMQTKVNDCVQGIDFPVDSFWISHISWNSTDGARLTVHYRCRKNSPLSPILGRVIRVHILTVRFMKHSLKWRFTVFWHVTPSSRDISASIVAWWWPGWLGNYGLIPYRGRDRFWGLPTFLYNK